MSATWPTGEPFRQGLDRTPDLFGIDIAGHRIDVREDGRRAQPDHRPYRGEERVGGRDDGVARTDPQRHERRHEGVRARGDTDRVSRPAVRGYLFFERDHARPQDEVLVVTDGIDGRPDLFSYPGILRLQI
jgi:hypothetical protein